MKRTVIGILAHVDAGKTTLSEAMLYCSGSIRKHGRVDHGNAFLDNFALERQRGITIFSKQAVFQLGQKRVTLLDTPGHVDFSAEMERTLDVLDCAVLVISAPAGVQSHTMTVWRLLRERNIPTFLFINKTDMPGYDKSALMQQLSQRLGAVFFDAMQPDYENLALCSESLLDSYLSHGTIGFEELLSTVYACRAFPCWFGSALKLDGIDAFMQGLEDYAPSCSDCGNFGAKVFKISHDEQGGRITHLKVTGGRLRVRDSVADEKITQLRVYSGAKFSPIDEAVCGDVVAVTGLTSAVPGMGLGCEAQGHAPTLEPVLTYSVILPDGYDVHKAHAQFSQLQSEEPQLHVSWDERTQQLSVQLMGPIQLEILHELLLERFSLDAQFGTGRIIYRETISNTVEGVGHYEPLRHYAEVHIILEPGERGSGITIASDCSEDRLDRNWQRLIITHLLEKQHLGVLTGSPITDMKITLAAGRAHEKHTEGGDFREATYRAVRQGLMQAESVLLEPWYDFRLELPQANLGRALNDLQRMGADFAPPVSESDCCIITGSAAVSAIGEYFTEVSSYTHGLGRFSCTPGAYRPCSEQQSIVEAFAYDPTADVNNSPDSVFCSHGAGYVVRWSEVHEKMHLPSVLSAPPQEQLEVQAARYVSQMASDNELMAIFERTYGPIKRADPAAMRPRTKSSDSSRTYKAKPRHDGQEFVLVDGYNIIHAWDELRKLAEGSLDDARVRLINILRNYQAFRQCAVIVVFDAYKVKGNPGSVEHFGGLSVVYTKEAETADVYIERATYDLAKKHFVRVATSDGLEQVIILGHGALRISAQSFEEEVRDVEKTLRSFLYNP